MAADHHFTFTDIAAADLDETLDYIRAWHPGDERISKELSSASTRDDSPGLIEFARQHEIAVSGGCLPS